MPPQLLKYSKVSAALLLTLLNAAALQDRESSGDALYMPDPGSFVIVDEETSPTGFLKILAEPGETKDNWTRAMAFSYFERKNINEFIDTIRRSGRGCPGFRLVLQARTKDEARFQTHCDRYPKDGLPEVTFTKVIARGPDVTSAAIMFRYEPDAEEVSWARSYLEGFYLCRPGSSEPRCQQ